MLQATATARDAEAVDRIGPADPLRPRRVAWLGGSAAAAALAAAGLVLVLWPRTDLEPLPGYFAELSGGVQEMRGPETPPWPSATTVFAPGNTFDLVLRPDRAVTGPVEVRIFLEHEQTLREWRVPRDIVDTGAARIRGEVGLEIDLPPGASTLYVVLGRPGSLPSGEELGDHLAGLYQVSAEDWVAWRREVELRSP